MLGFALGAFAALALASALRLGVLSLRNREPRGYVLALTLVAIGVADGHASLVEMGSLSSAAGKAMRLVVVSAILVYTVIELRDLILRDRERALLAQGESERSADRLVAEMSYQERFVHDARNALLAIQGGLRSLESGTDHEMVTAITSEVDRLRNAPGGRWRRPPSCNVRSGRCTWADDCLLSGCRAWDHADRIGSNDCPRPTEHRCRGRAEPDRDALVYGGDGEITVWVLERREFIEVRVADRGTGVDLDLDQSIFDHGKSGGEGSGVGLHISRRLIEQQGGTLSVTGRHGGGSIFAFTLPRAEVFESTWLLEDRLSV